MKDIKGALGKFLKVCQKKGFFFTGQPYSTTTGQVGDSISSPLSLPLSLSSPQFLFPPCDRRHPRTMYSVHVLRARGGTGIETNKASRAFRKQDATRRRRRRMGDIEEGSKVYWVGDEWGGYDGERKKLRSKSGAIEGEQRSIARDGGKKIFQGPFLCLGS